MDGAGSHPLAGTRVPDLIEPISGWRLWLLPLVGRRERLESPVYHLPWPPGRPVSARCGGEGARLGRLRRPPPHAAPRAACRCGIHAMASAERLIELSTPEGLVPFGWPVVGRVALWGRVIECRHGWRAEHAIPVDLVLPHIPAARGGLGERELRDARRRLAAYRVPVRVEPMARWGDLAHAIGLAPAA